MRVTLRSATEYGLDASTQALLSKRPNSIQSLVSLITRVVSWVDDNRPLNSSKDIGDLLKEFAAEARLLSSV